MQGNAASGHCFKGSVAIGRWSAPILCPRMVGNLPVSRLLRPKVFDVNPRGWRCGRTVRLGRTVLKVDERPAGRLERSGLRSQPIHLHEGNSPCATTSLGFTRESPNEALPQSSTA